MTEIKLQIDKAGLFSDWFVENVEELLLFQFFGGLVLILTCALEDMILFYRNLILDSNKEMLNFNRREHLMSMRKILLIYLNRKF